MKLVVYMHFFAPSIGGVESIDLLLVLRVFRRPTNSLSDSTPPHTTRAAQEEFQNEVNPAGATHTQRGSFRAS